MAWLMLWVCLAIAASAGVGLGLGLWATRPVLLIRGELGDAPRYAPGRASVDGQGRRPQIVIGCRVRSLVSGRTGVVHAVDRRCGYECHVVDDLGGWWAAEAENLALEQWEPLSQDELLSMLRLAMAAEEADELTARAQSGWETYERTGRLPW